MNFEQYLRDSGATEDDIKILNTPVAQKAFAKQQEQLQAATELAAKHKTEADNVYKWYQEKGLPYATRMEQERNVARAAAAAEKARVQALVEAGLIEDPGPATPPASATPPGQPGDPALPDPNKYVSIEKFQELATRAAGATTLIQDLSDEHRSLGLPAVSWRALQKEAQEKGTDVESLWRTKFNVDAKRSEKQAADKLAYEKKIADEAIAKYKSENANPLTTSALPSRTPFTGKVPSASDATMPWNKSETERVNDRLSKLQQKNPDAFLN